MATLIVTPIQSLDAPELLIYRTLQRIEQHERAGVLVATNVKVVQRLLTSRFEVLSALLTMSWLEKLEVSLKARHEKEIAVYVGEKSLLETITGYHLHQGALAVGKIPAQPTFDALLATSPRPLLLAAVEGIASAENLGAIVRGCAAFGVHFLVVGETCVSPYQRRVISGSVGSIFEQPVVRAENLVATLNKLRANGVWCVAAHLGPAATKLSAVDLRGDSCIVFGAEGPGLSDAVISACDDIVEIAMPTHMNSLNVAAAAAVFLYEATRQRGRL
jgi:tRNA G18 (ribose-2'-O)-methylase SpoU